MDNIKQMSRWIRWLW